MSSGIGLAIFELVKNAIDGNRVYEKKSETDSKPDVKLTAVNRDGWVELRIINRGILAVDKLRAQAREEGVWKLRPWTPDKHRWPYPYIMESSMPDEPMPYQRMRPEEVDALSDDDLLFHVKGLTLRREENLRRIGLTSTDLTGGMGIGLKQVWRVMADVDPERPVHYETGEIDGVPTVVFSVRFPEAPRNELRADVRDTEQESAAPGARSELRESSKDEGREAMLRLRDAMASAVTTAMKQRGYRVELLPGYPEGLYVHIYPADPGLAERLSRIDHTADLRLIEVPYGSLGMAVISMAKVGGEIVPYIEQIQPSYSFRKAASEEPAILGAAQFWADHFVSWTELSARQAGFRDLYAKTPFIARRQNIEMGHGKANRYYSKPFRAAGFHLLQSSIHRADMTAEEVVAANRSSQYLNAKGQPQFFFGGDIPVWYKSLDGAKTSGRDAFLTRVYKQHHRAVISGFRKTMEAWGARRFILLDGMRFGDETTWWKDISREASHGEKSHTGIDLALYEKPDGHLTSVPEGLPVFSVMDGKVRWIFPDNMRQTVIVETQIHQRKVYSVYTHIQVRSDLKEGQYLLHGEPLGTTAASNNDKSIVAAHVHYGLGYFLDEKDSETGEPMNYDTINRLYKEGKMNFVDLLKMMPGRIRQTIFASGPEWENTMRSILIRGSGPEEAALRRTLYRALPGLKEVRLDTSSPVRDLAVIRSGEKWRLEFAEASAPEEFMDAAGLIERLRTLEASRASGARSELRQSSLPGENADMEVEKMTAPAAVFLDASELVNLKEGEADERFDELLTFLDRHPAFDIYIDHGDRYPVHNLPLAKLQKLLSEYSGRIHIGEQSRANLTKKKIILQVSLLASGGSADQTLKTLDGIRDRYHIKSEIIPVEYLQAGVLKGFLDLAESFGAADLLRQAGEAFVTRNANGRWSLAADFAASLWAKMQADYTIQWSA